MNPWILIDERSRPTLRERLGRQLVSADAADFAVARIRLAALDLTEEEVRGTAHWRVLLGELDAAMLLEATERAPSSTAPEALPRLRRLADSGRLEVRSAGLGSWAPDFALVRSAGATVLAMGAIYFGQPRLINGPSLTLLTDHEASARKAAERFGELWERSHDVLPAIVDVLERADGPGMGARGGRR